MIIKKITAAVSALAMSAGVLAYMPNSTEGGKAVAADASKYNYAEALQKSMFFYEVQQAGKLPEWNEVAWKADSMVDESGEETDVCKGGWYDAGDHFKFTLTNAYTAAILAWGYLEYKDAVDKQGLGELYRNNVQWGLDYLMQCDRGDKIIGTIGDFKGGSTDHNIWCSSEVYLRKHHLNGGDWKRPYDEIDDSCTMALSAAALAEGYIMFKDTQPDKAKAYLDQAKTYFKTADKIRNNENGAMGSMYNPSSWVDDCMFAAIWLYRATGDKSYMDKVESDYIPKFPLEDQSKDRKFTWGLCWDDTSQAAALLYAQETKSEEWIQHVTDHLDYWIDGAKGKKVQYTPDGMAWLFSWGSARHVSATCWLAKLASDTIFKDNSSLQDKYNKWAKGQMDYIFGDNGLKMSYVLGMGDKQPTAFHHRTASGIHDDHWNHLGQASGGAEGWQTEYAHTLYGALVGGPDQTGKYVNDVSKYEYSEVAIDYNAGYTACLCALVDDYGGTTDPSFPPDETPSWPEWEVAAVINGTPAASYTELKVWAMNHTAWPARVAKDVEYRYFFDVSEVIENGLSVDDIKVEGKSQQYKEGEQGYATVSGPYKYEKDTTGNTYYALIKFEDGRAIQPTGQSEHRDEVQFRISIPDAIDGKSTAGAWDATNDWSYLGGLAKASDLKKADSLNEHMPMYVNGELVWGEEPDGTKFVAKPCTKKSNGSTPTTTTTTTGKTTTTTTTATTTVTTVVTTTEETEGPAVTKWGDANCDGEVDFGDIVLVMQSLANPNKYGVNGTDDHHITAQGIANADVYDNGSKLTTNDAQTLQKYLLHIITELPEKK
ncbi:MAG: glycoside hydrolase family 9 protein [Ruminococcus sp.]|uniref:glycoside hydrolase family 9 protein n=1 Tax=Ruminococcus sp. TaxID=41978 RepID=UPI0025EFCF29|nr:glycoside hydrolase family 9 protein [Ruminococcus sp.]MCR4795999.1 glycoside hydrolase family 9 protein [Ruminococcus sp.]